MLNLWKDVQYALRTLTKNPGFAIIGIVTLALGMAVNTALFSVINGFLLRPLPVPHPEQITVLSLQQASLPGARRFSYPDFEDFRSQTDSFSDIFAFRVTLVAVAVDQKADHCIISRVSNNFFSALGIQPAYGRLILPSEGRTPGADPIVVLGYSYWRKRFAGDPDVVGKKVEVNGQPSSAWPRQNFTVLTSFSIWTPTYPSARNPASIPTIRFRSLGQAEVLERSLSWVGSSPG
jgi:hypothetical protein